MIISEYATGNILVSLVVVSSLTFLMSCMSCVFLSDIRKKQHESTNRRFREEAGLPVANVVTVANV